MKTDINIIDEAMEALSSKLNLVEMEKFVGLLQRKGFDYTEWRRNLWQNDTVESLSAKAQENYEKKKINN